MKKLSLLTLAFMTLLGVNAQDQDHKPLRTEMASKVRFGLRSGVNLATIEIDDENTGANPNTNMKTSFHAGIFVNIPMGNFRLQPELQYSVQGTKTATGSIRSEVDMDYINIPIMAQLSTGSSGFFVELGPQFGFLLKANQETNNVDVDIKDNIKGFDFGIGAGVGYVSRIGLGLTGRYVHGISNIYDVDGSNNDDNEWSNRTVQISLVYHFGAAK